MCDDFIENASERDKFALMLHARLVDLEARVAASEPVPPDRRLHVDRELASDATYVRIRSAEHPSLDEVARTVLKTLEIFPGGKDVFACDYYCGLYEGFVTEVLVCAETKLSVTRVAHAVLDACESSQPAFAFACGVHDQGWFAAGMRCAMGDGAVSWAWNPKTRDVETRECPWLPGDEDDYTGTGRGRTLLQAWLVSEREVTDVLHPRAPSARQLASRLEHCVATIDETL